MQSCTMVQLCTCLFVLLSCQLFSTHPVTEHISHKEVTEHFAKTKPGEIVRIPSSVFSNIQADEEFDFNFTSAPSVPFPLLQDDDQPLNKSSKVESKSANIEQLIGEHRDHSETPSVLAQADLAELADLSEQLGNQTDLYDKLFHAFDGGIVSYFENTTNNPLANLKENFNYDC